MLSSRHRLNHSATTSLPQNNRENIVGFHHNDIFQIYISSGLVTRDPRRQVLAVTAASPPRRGLTDVRAPNGLLKQNPRPECQPVTGHDAVRPCIAQHHSAHAHPHTRIHKKRPLQTLYQHHLHCFSAREEISLNTDTSIWNASVEGGEGVGKEVMQPAPHTRPLKVHCSTPGCSASLGVFIVVTTESRQEIRPNPLSLIPQHKYTPEIHKVLLTHARIACTCLAEIMLTLISETWLLRPAQASSSY